MDEDTVVVKKKDWETAKAFYLSRKNPEEFKHDQRKCDCCNCG